MNKVLLMSFCFVQTLCFAQNTSYKDTTKDISRHSYNDSLNSLQINYGENNIDHKYFLDSSYLKFQDIKELSLWMELDNKSDLYIKENILPQFEQLWNIEIIRKNKGNFFFPTDINRCPNLKRLYIDLGSHKSDFKRIPIEIKTLPTLEYFEIIFSKRFGNRKLILDLKELISESKSLKGVTVIYKNRKFKKLIKLGNKYGIKINN